MNDDKYPPNERAADCCAWCRHSEYESEYDQEVLCTKHDVMVFAMNICDDYVNYEDGFVVAVQERGQLSAQMVRRALEGMEDGNDG